jgi:hypothetical protein
VLYIIDFYLLEILDSLAYSLYLLSILRLAAIVLWMQQPDSNKVNAIMVAASSAQVDVGRNAGGTHARRTPGIYTYSTLAVLAVSDNCPPF